MTGVGKRTYLREVNPYLICPLCRGYLIDATTVVECLHSFCRSCILKHLNTEAHCPSCKHVLNKAKPNIKADKALQDIVYKLVPGLYHKEMRKRREFYKKHPEHADSATPEQRGEDVSGRLFFAPEDAVSLSLEYLPPGADPLAILLSTSDSDSNNSNSHNSNNNNNTSNNNHNTSSNRRYLQCPALVTIAHLKKFLALKYSVDMTRYTIEICHRRAPLPEHWTLMDVAYIYAWKRNAPMRFFYRVALEEQRLEAPPHERPSTPGVGASLPPSDAVVNEGNNPRSAENGNNGVESRQEIERTARNRDSNGNNVAEEKSQAVVKQQEENKTVDRIEKPSPTILPPTTSPGTTTTNSTSGAAANDDFSNRQIKTPIKILKNPDGRYEVLKSPPAGWNPREQASNPADVKTSSPEFSVVSIGAGQNSNGVKITLKQCSPTSTSPNKPKVISNVLLRCGQVEKDSSAAVVIQQVQKDKEKQQQAHEKQEKQKRKVTFMESTPSEKTVNNLPKLAVKRAEQQDKKQFLQAFQLAARETVCEKKSLDSSTNADDGKSEGNVVQSKSILIKREPEDSVKNEIPNKGETKDKSNSENTNLNVNANKRIPALTGITAARGNPKQVDETRVLTSTTAADVATNKTTPTKTNQPTKMDIYNFSSDPPVVPAGAVKRKCPPGLPIFDLKRKKQQTQLQTAKRQAIAVQNQPLAKSPRKNVPESPVPIKRPVSISDPGPSRIPNTTNTKSPNSALPNDTRNLLDGCGLNIPASLSITLTAPKSPGANGSVESSDSKDNRKNILGKVSPSITLNDRSVDPRVLKALKSGQIRMPAPSKPRQLKETPEAQQQQQQHQQQQQQQQHQPSQQQQHQQSQQQQRPVTGKRKREQESKDILDLSGGKKMDIHPLRIPQPVPKLKAKPVRDNLPKISDQGQVVTLMGGHRYYRAPPGSLTPAAHRVTDCPIPTPSRAPVYAPTGLSSPPMSRSNSNLSSVFPSLQSLYALSQAPNLQQFQIDARLRLSRDNPPVNGNGTGNTSSENTPSKTHLAAQCAPVKPARSSVASLAVPITKSSHRTACTNRTLTNKPPVFRVNERADSNDANQRLSVQTSHSPVAETDKRYSPRSSTTTSGSASEEQATETREQNTESNGISDESVNSTRQHNHETASPRVSSTASPSPPPSDGNTTVKAEEDDRTEVNPVSEGTAGTKANVVSNEVSSSKSPASPDSSSVTVDTTKTSDPETTTASTTSTTTTTTTTVTAATTTEKAKTEPVKSDSSVPEEPVNEEEKAAPAKQSDPKQLTSEMFQKRLLAAFPSNEWANNPIAAEHLGNFLKSLNASMKPENQEESEAVKVESQTACEDSACVAEAAKRKDVAEKT